MAHAHVLSHAVSRAGHGLWRGVSRAPCSRCPRAARRRSVPLLTQLHLHDENKAGDRTPTAMRADVAVTRRAVDSDGSQSASEATAVAAVVAEQLAAGQATPTAAFTPPRRGRADGSESGASSSSSARQVAGRQQADSHFTPKAKQRTRSRTPEHEWQASPRPRCNRANLAAVAPP